MLSNYANRSDDVLSSLGAEFIEFVQQERQSYIQFIPQIIITVAKVSITKAASNRSCSINACMYL